MVLGAGDAAGMGFRDKEGEGFPAGKWCLSLSVQGALPALLTRNSVGWAGAGLRSRMVPQSLLSTLPSLGAGGRGCSQSLDTEIETFILWDQQDTAF